jgi:hypothetical protein
MLVAAAALAADAFAIAAAVVATTTFPQPFHLIQLHPWWSVIIFSVAGVLFMAWLYLHDNTDSGTTTPPPREQGNDGLNIKDSKLKKSGIWTLKKARVNIEGSKLRNSSVVVRDDSTPGTS